MKVKKRDGSLTEVDFNKIQKRLKDLSKDLKIDIPEITQKMVSSIYDGVSTKELDEHLSTTVVNYDIHPDYNTLAGRILVSSLHKETALNHFTEYHEERLLKMLKKGKVSEESKIVQKFKSALFEDPKREEILAKALKGNKVKEKDLEWLCKVPRFYYVIKTMNKEGIINKEVLDFVEKHRKEIEDKIDYSRDFMFDFFGMKTLEKAYLLKKFSKNKVIKEIVEVDEKEQPTGKTILEETEQTAEEIMERPQDLFMRVAVGILRRLEENSLERVFELYDMLSQGYYTHATPTLFNAGTRREQMSSCFTKGTEVYTINRGVVDIDKVKVGDEVVTHTGKVRKVKQIHKNLLNKRTVFDIKCHKTKKFSVTGNHKFLSLTKEQKNWGKKPQWNSMEMLRVGDWIQIPNKKGGLGKLVLDVKDYNGDSGYEGMNISFDYTKDKVKATTTYQHKNFIKKGKKYVSNCKKEHYPINRKILIDEDFMFFLGVWMGDGCVYSQNSTSKKQQLRGVGVTIHKKNVELIKKIKKIMEKKFGLRVEQTKARRDNCVHLRIRSYPLSYFFVQAFGRGFANKRLPEFVYKMNKKMIEVFLMGLVTSDGCISKEGNVTVAMSNIPLMKGVYHLARSVGVLLSYTEFKGAGKNPVARVCFPQEIVRKNIKHIVKRYNDDRLKYFKAKKNKEKKVIEIDGEIFTRIDSKEFSQKKPKYVYTLGVEGDHSYSVEGLIAENCFLLKNESDSIEGIFSTFTEEALISKNAGGIGVAVSNIRSRDSIIKGTNGKSNGIIPFLKIKNEVARGVNQGGKRKGSIAVYLEPWHADVEEFIRLKRPDGSDEERARDLFLALWMPDLFYKRVEEGGKWSLFDPATAPNLDEVYGDEFVALYEKYEKQGRAVKVIDAREFQKDIFEMQIETGVPYILNKDQCNIKSNQKNLGTIKSSNLCTEVIEYTDEEETAVCNLASICLSKFVVNKKFDFKKLHEVVQVATKNLNEVIDINYYVNEKTKRSNLRHRPIGLGVQGLADVFFMLGLPYSSEEARDLNEEIFETIYHGALTASLELAKKDGHYPSMKENGGAPITKGILQFDMWNHSPRSNRYSKTRGKNLSWEDLREEIKEHGLRNSLLVAPMPTASTAIIFSNCASFEPETQNIYKRKTISGEFLVANKYLIKKLEEEGIWSEEIKSQLIINNGSIQEIEVIPKEIREVYKTVWEIKLKPQIDMAADRGAYICQSQSFNVHMETPSMSNMKNFYMYAWKKGLKTMSYYFRSTAAAENQKVTVQKNTTKPSTSQEEDDDCLVCGS